ncbi:hypothetical protein HGRIS_005619 [Hohenbuehelia grisea]|uniref:F-box domain-containing protein n=1 Tax=Hohenbuehelia grisea TaxID=104357 RepID=A0ABR3JYU9_9AGAR
MAPAAKKVCTTLQVTLTPKPRQRRRGCLAPLLDPQTCPYDVLVAILSSFTPLDLLHLAWTSKDMHAFLLSKRQRFIWKDALSSIDGLPQCPRDLTEPQYAFLVFCPLCHRKGCNKRTQDILWELRARFCKDCRPYELSYKAPPGGVLPAFPSQDGGYTRPPTDYFRRSQVTAYQKAIAGLDIVAREAFKVEKSREAAEIREHAQKCRKYVMLAQVARCTELGSLREGRSEAYVALHMSSTSSLLSKHSLSFRQNVLACGWGEEVEFHGWDKIVSRRPDIFYKPNALTSRYWNRVEGEVQALMGHLRWERLDAQVYTTRRNLAVQLILQAQESMESEKSFGGLVPTIADIVFHHDFRQIIEASPDTIVTEASFSDAVANIPSIMSAWQHELASCLRGLLPCGSKTPPEAVDKRLQLASTLFSCTRCDETHIPFSMLVTHAWSSYRERVFLPHDEQPYYEVYKALDSRPWSCGGHLTAQELHPSATQVMDFLGVDADAKAEQLDIIHGEVKLRCYANHILKYTRSGSRADRAFYGWRGALRHASIYHSGPKLSSVPLHLAVSHEVEYNVRRSQLPLASALGRLSGKTTG